MVFKQDVASMILDQESEAKKLRTEYMEVILGFGDVIMEIICRDACSGHDITRMLSLAVLDVAVSLDSQQQWLAFLDSKGYLRHILDSLSKDDEELQNLFNRNSHSFRIFYVFESKMALLTRISCSTKGALDLLRNGAIHKLAECRALDLRPDLPNEFKQESSNWMVPDLLKCYRQMFMAIMKLILSIAMTLGSDHREATLQLLEFVVCNGELFSHVIRDPSNLYTIEALEELSVISAVLSRASFDDPNTLSSDTFLSEQRGHLLLLRQHMLMLIPRLMAVEGHDPGEEPEPDFQPRTIIVKKGKDVKSEYNLNQELGRGKFGTVHRCTEKATGKVFAAKFITTPKQQDRLDVEREVEIMTILQHPRLLQLYDAFDDGKKSMCLILEIIEGGELFERVIDEDFVLTEKAVTIFMRQICEGVLYMHSKNILHLDMKPENVLCISRTGNKIKLIDFGLARKYDPKKKLKVLFGTPEFVAPEVVCFESIGYTTDMWSVGVICYVLLSGLSPFMGDSDMETMANVTRSEWDFEDESFDEISEDAKDFISKLLLKDQKKRLNASQALQHAWLRRDKKKQEQAIDKKKLKRFVIRRRWQKAVNALIALIRMGATI